MESIVNQRIGYLMAYSGLFRLIPLQFHPNSTPIRQSTRPNPLQIVPRQHITYKGFIDTDNRRRWATYRFKNGNHAPGLFDTPTTPGDSSHNPGDSSHNEGDSSHMEPIETAGLSEAVRKVVQSVRTRPALMEQAILELCHDQYLTAQQLATLLNRNPAALRNRYISPLVASGKLQKRFPHQGNRPDQAYIASNTPTNPTAASRNIA